MPRYVSYDALAECFEHLREKKECEVLEEIAITLSNKFIEVVHCKECKHLYTTECPCSYLRPRKSEPGCYSVEYPDDDFFCKRGERVDADEVTECIEENTTNGTTRKS